MKAKSDKSILITCLIARGCSFFILIHSYVHFLFCIDFKDISWMFYNYDPM